MPNYPRGKLNDNDEGELSIKVFVKDNTVMIDFGKKISWVGLDKFTAFQLAEALARHSNSIEIVGGNGGVS